MSRKPKTLMEVIYARTRSFKKSGRIFTFVTVWAAALEETGQQELNVERFKDWAEPEWNRRTVDRWLLEFREAFPDQRTPHRFAQLMNDYRADAQAQKFAPDYAAVVAVA